MINLCVESYCQNCPYFEPVAEKMFDDSIIAIRAEVHTEVHCKDMNKCDGIHNQIVNDEAKKLGDAIKRM